MRCPVCQNSISRFGAWRSSTGVIYCSEFCAEVESFETVPAAGPEKSSAEQPLGVSSLKRSTQNRQRPTSRRPITPSLGHAADIAK
jgi:hypothetical protein